MVYRFNWLLLLLCVYVSSTGSEIAVEQITKKLRVRVLLDEKEIYDRGYEWSISTEQKLLITDLDNSANKYIGKMVRVVVKNDGIHVANAQQDFVTQSLKLQSEDGYFFFNGKWYQGLFYIFKLGRKALIINSLDIEDYVFSVVKSEGFPGWPLEVNKVFAVAVRSYAIDKILKAQKKGSLYHIKNTNIHQTYSGYHESDEIRKAIEETAGLFLAYDNKPILAMYDICCGGIIPAQKKGIKNAALPYLARTYPCTFCKQYKVYRWVAEYTPDHLERLLQRELKQLRSLKEIKVCKKDKAGLAERVLIKASSGHHYLSGKKMYALLKGLKSFCFSAYKKDRKIIFKGHGYGHHMGLCQWGARNLVHKGWGYRRILHFYYPGTEFMKLS